MKTRSLDLSNRSELRELAQLFREISPVLDELTTSWFVIGAVARDLLLHHGFGLPI